MACHNLLKETKIKATKVRKKAPRKHCTISSRGRLQANCLPRLSNVTVRCCKLKGNVQRTQQCYEATAYGLHNVGELAHMRTVLNQIPRSKALPISRRNIVYDPETTLDVKITMHFIYGAVARGLGSSAPGSLESRPPDGREGWRYDDPSARDSSAPCSGSALACS